jgi:hypothetical protein
MLFRKWKMYKRWERSGSQVIVEMGTAGVTTKRKPKKPQPRAAAVPHVHGRF